jgi:hypothetical protein
MIKRQIRGKKYLLDFIKECGLSYDNSGKTFIKPIGEECSELDYFLLRSSFRSPPIIILCVFDTFGRFHIVGLCSQRIHRHSHGFLLVVDRLKLLRILYHYYYWFLYTGSELDYFLYTINYKFCTKKEVLNNTITNVSDHHPVKMTIMLPHDIKNLKEGENSNIRLKVKWYIIFVGFVGFP